MPPENKDPFAEFVITPPEEQETAVATEPDTAPDVFSEFEIKEGAPKADPFVEFIVEAPPAPELPTVQEQGVSVLDRNLIHAMRGSPELQANYLKEQGYLTEPGAEGTIKVRRPEDKQWKVVDPKGLTSIGDALQDANEAIPDIAMMLAGGGLAGTAAKAGGKAAVSAAKKFGPKIIDRLLSISPSYRMGKSALKLAKGLKGKLDKVDKALPSGGKSKKDALKDLEDFFRPKK